MADDFYKDMRDEDLHDETHTTQAMSTYDITRMSQFSQVTTEIPPSFDGKTSWFAYEDAIDDWCDITELDDEKRGPALHYRLEGDAAIYKKILDRDALKKKDEGVLYFKRTLRPFFVKVKVLDQILRSTLSYQHSTQPNYSGLFFFYALQLRSAGGFEPTVAE